MQASHNTNTFCWSTGTSRESPDTCLQPQPRESPTTLSQLAVQVIWAGLQLTVVTYSVVVCICATHLRLLCSQWRDIGN